MLSLVRRRAVNGLADVFSAGDLSQGSLTSYSKVDDDRVAMAAGPEIAVVGGASVRGANFNAGGAATGGAGGSGYVRITEFNSQ
jgi:hypothetical protein